MCASCGSAGVLSTGKEQSPGEEEDAEKTREEAKVEKRRHCDGFPTERDGTEHARIYLPCRTLCSVRGRAQCPSLDPRMVTFGEAGMTVVSKHIVAAHRLVLVGQHRDGRGYCVSMADFKHRVFAATTVIDQATSFDMFILESRKRRVCRCIAAKGDRFRGVGEGNRTVTTGASRV